MEGMSWHDSTHTVGLIARILGVRAHVKPPRSARMMRFGQRTGEGMLRQ